jgi:hypothetical protein
MSLSAEFDTVADRRAYAVVAAGAAVLSYTHARAFFLPFMGPDGAAATPLMLDAVVFWLASANVRQAKAGRPLPMLRAGAYALLGLAITANALGGATWPERVFLALPAALFGFLVEARTRLALYQHRAEHGDDRLRLRLWARHPVRTVRAWLWLARQSAPAFDRATAERDRLAAARDAVRLALPGRARAVRRARAGVLRELNAGRLAPAAAVAASGLMDAPGVPELHRAALAAALGGTTEAHDAPDTGTEIDTVREALRTEIASVRDYAQWVATTAAQGIEQALGVLRTEIASVRAGLRTEIAAVRAPAPDPRTDGPAVDRAALVAGLADQIRDAISSGERWAPDYDALMARTGFRRSWCEKAVRDARTQAFSAPHADGGHTDAAPRTSPPSAMAA